MNTIGPIILFLVGSIFLLAGTVWNLVNALR